MLFTIGITLIAVTGKGLELLTIGMTLVAVTEKGLELLTLGAGDRHGREKVGA